MHVIKAERILRLAPRKIPYERGDSNFRRISTKACFKAIAPVPALSALRAVYMLQVQAKSLWLDRFFSDTFQ